MKIGELAKATGLSAETIRYYERAGLLPRHRRTGGGYRIFGGDDLERIEFVKQAKRLGLSLAEVRDILAVRAADQPTCVHVRTLLEAKVEEVDRARRELAEFEASLRALLECTAELVDCRPEGGRICSIVETASLPDRPQALERIPARTPSAP